MVINTFSERQNISRISFVLSLEDVGYNLVLACTAFFASLSYLFIYTLNKSFKKDIDIRFVQIGFLLQHFISKAILIKMQFE